MQRAETIGRPDVPMRHSSKMYALLVLLTLLTVFSTEAATGSALSRDRAFLESGTFILRNNTDYRYLTATGTESADSPIVLMEAYIQNPNRQEWRFVRQKNGYYRIKAGSGLCLSHKKRITPSVEPEANDDSQLWLVTLDRDGFYHLKSKAGRHLEVYAQPSARPTIVGLSREADNSNKQQWHLIKWSEDTRKITSFLPNVHGFKFANTCEGVDGSYRYGGLCGGMTYAALDYHCTGKAVPPQTFRPANASPIIYLRQAE